MLERVPPQFRELQEITIQTDTRDILAHATRQAESYEDYFLVDIDAHVTETQFWPEIIAMIDNDVIRQMGEASRGRPGSGNIALLNAQPGHALPARLWSHPAPAGAAGEGREEGLPSFHRARAPLHGRDGPRLPGRVPDADAHARHAPAGRHRGRRSARPTTTGWSSASCRRTIASRACSICRSTRRRPASSWSRNTPHVDSVIGYHGRFDAQQAGASQHLHAALCDDRGDRQAARLPLRLQLGRSVVRCSSTASSPCTRCRSCTTA